MFATLYSTFAGDTPTIYCRAKTLMNPEKQKAAKSWVAANAHGSNLNTWLCLAFLNIFFGNISTSVNYSED
jgi:hypothetical protein